MVCPITPTNKTEVNYFPWVKDELNVTFLANTFCVSPAEMVAIWVLFSIELPVICLAIYGLCFLFKSDQPVPIFVINLFLTDVIQICTKPTLHVYTFSVGTVFLFNFYVISLQANIGFMVCISLERYIMIKYPVWYRFHRSFKYSVLICLLVWVIPCAEMGALAIIVYKWSVQYGFLLIVFFLLIPYPLVVFSFVGSWRALSNSVSVTPNEQKKILKILALVLFIYSVLFLPGIVQDIIFFVYFEYEEISGNLHAVSNILMFLNPLADSLLYVFIRKDANSMFRCLC